MNRHEEYHVTVEGDPFQWRGFCAAVGIKPLWIELSTFERQLMCAAKYDPTRHIELTGAFKIVRVKHEVSELQEFERALYWECHVKLNGPFYAKAPMASRDLYRPDRWYITRREDQPFDYLEFVDWVKFHSAAREGLTVAGFEYEAALKDTNRDLDGNWILESTVLR